VEVGATELDVVESGADVGVAHPQSTTSSPAISGLIVVDADEAVRDVPEPR